MYNKGITTNKEALPIEAFKPNDIVIVKSHKFGIFLGKVIETLIEASMTRVEHIGNSEKMFYSNEQISLYYGDEKIFEGGTKMNTQLTHVDLFENEVSRYECCKRCAGAFKQDYESFLSKTLPLIFEHQERLLDIQMVALTDGDLETVARINGRILTLSKESSRSFERNTDY